MLKKNHKGKLQGQRTGLHSLKTRFSTAVLTSKRAMQVYII